MNLDRSRALSLLSLCPECGGDGDFANESSATHCQVCDGYGRVEVRRDHPEIEPVQCDRKAGKHTSPKTKGRAISI